MLQSAIDHSALKDRALAAERASQLIAAPAAGSVGEGIALAAKATTDGSQSTPQVLTVSHSYIRSRLVRGFP